MSHGIAPRGSKRGVDCPGTIFVSTQKNAYTTTVTAQTQQQVPLGKIEAVLNAVKDGRGYLPTLHVVNAVVGAPGCGIGTRLYEALAQDACARGVAFASDTVLSRYSKGFWTKQKTRGRAREIASRFIIEEPCQYARNLSGVKRKKRSR